MKLGNWYRRLHHEWCPGLSKQPDKQHCQVLPHTVSAITSRSGNDQIQNREVRTLLLSGNTCTSEALSVTSDCVLSGRNVSGT